MIDRVLYLVETMHSVETMGNILAWYNIPKLLDVILNTKFETKLKFPKYKQFM